MRRIIAAVFLSIALPIGANAFDNIEADVFYDGALKEQIAKEFSIILVGLQNQAKELGVEPRKKDINEAKGHFTTKAILIARCFDKGISIKKMTSKDIDLNKYSSGCVKLHTEFMSSPNKKLSINCSMNNRLDQTRLEPSIYDFLKIPYYEEGSFWDDVALRDCYLRENHLPETWTPRR